jgi:hypothetical protein
MLYKVSITDVAIGKRRNVAVYIVDAESTEAAEADCHRENPLAFSKAAAVEVKAVGHSSIKFLAYTIPATKLAPPVSVDKKQAEELALRFANTLREEIGPRNFATMKKRNAKVDRKKESVCHSHDFCDANMTMYAAFQEVTGRETVYGDNDTALWNTAWDIAFEKYLK